MTVKEVGFMPTAILWLSFEQSCKPIEVYETFYCACIYFQWYMQVFLSDALQTQQKKMLTCSSDAISVELFPPRNIAPYVHLQSSTWSHATCTGGATQHYPCYQALNRI